MASKGGRTTAKAHQAQKREEKLQARRDSGKVYKYKKNPYSAGTIEWQDEDYNRRHKNDSHKTELQRMISLLAKLDYEMSRKAIAKKNEVKKK